MHRLLTLLALMTCLAGLALAADSDSELPQGDPNAGEHFYLYGITATGDSVPVTLRGDVQSTSETFACAACHRPSGFGGSEGGEYVPIITQPVLYNERRPDRQRRNREFMKLFKDTHSSSFDARVRMPRMRPAYSDDSLAAAIQHGIDPAGQSLSESMPRYQFDQQSMADLIAYLKTLSVAASPGVTADTLHLATIVSAGVDQNQRDALINTLQTFAQWYNDDILGQQAHPGFSPYYRSEFEDSYRNWQLHVWTLKGPRETWRQQLQDYNNQQPVFAVVSGLVDGPWQPVDSFCKDEKLPCVFPITDLPDTDNANRGYAIYFSRGLELEGEVLAKYLGRQDILPEEVRQIRVDQAAGTVPGDAFSETLRQYLPTLRVDTVTVPAAGLAQAIAEAPATEVLVIWPGEHIETAIQALNAHAPDAGQIVLPSTALSIAQQQLSLELLDRVRLTYRYEKPSAYHPRKYRVRAWFGSRRVRLEYPLMQLQAFYAMTQMQYALDGIIGDFYRDYLIEFIEHEAEARLNPGTYPSLALGPGQRFASKGGYIIELTDVQENADSDNYGYRAISEWIVP